jgi:hypothetical protein
LWILVLGGSVVALAVFCLWVPLDIVFDVDVHGRPRVAVSYSWLFGLVKRRAKQKEKPPEGTPARRRRRRPDIRLIYRLLKTRGLLKNFARLGKSTLGSFHWTGLAGDFRIGLGDPADTGMLFAVLGPATAFLGPAVFERISLQPAFEEEVVFEGYSRGRARLRPIRLVPPVVRFAFSRPAARAAWTMLKARVRRKR